MSDTYGRWKERARWYTEGLQENHGFGLTCDKTDRELYDAANGLLHNGNFLYACDVSKPILVKSVPSNFHKSQSWKVIAYLVRSYSAMSPFTTWCITLCMKLSMKLRTPLASTATPWDDFSTNLN